ncbi:aminotransferase class V-fold PLP-dependent enzyme [Caulobacter sp.]|uniref:aminotransferase class V-fold PLP-dependent enzyme n=1 Tax=Caulobacter sp. TaxID=78 RepID=UPI001B2A09D5|nr:aminotransferase class V-fold PLP-dependent enzyme [Caulobacter sp.]MBO9545760.1 aminotransferase class V-fold PLP-dependent enzyme [Caulobacter sp.]
MDAAGQAVSARKDLFSKALSVPGRLHMAAHSHHLWPDATLAAQLEAWEDAVVLADHKWGKALGEVYPAAQGLVARELNLPSSDTVVFAPNTHTLLAVLKSAVSRKPVRILSTDGEFHSFRRQAQRWLEAGEIELTLVDSKGPDFADRFIAAARGGDYDLIFVSHVFFKTGFVFDRVWELADLSRPEGPWLVVDGYHGFRAVPTDLSAVADRVFYLAGGYKYAMAGEGAAFLHAPPGFGPRPVLTGWYAEFGDLEGPPGGVGYTTDAQRFMGATFDPSGLYRFVAAGRMLEAEGLTTATVAAHVGGLMRSLVAAEPLKGAVVLNPPGEGPQARFLALRHEKASAWKQALGEKGVVVDVRDDVLRIGLSIYHDEADVAAFREACSHLT